MKTTPTHKIMAMAMVSTILVSYASDAITGRDLELSTDERAFLMLWLVGWFICMAIDRLADEVTLLREMKRDR